MCCPSSPQLRQHLADFPARLSQRWGQAWDYAPLPPVAYPELAGEMWCHRYYLRSLCDEGRFPAWPIHDHVQLLQVRVGWCMGVSHSMSCMVYV